MAFRKHTVLAFALLVLVAWLAGCSNSTTSPVQPNAAPISAPTNVQAIVVNGHDIQISWNASSQISVKGYNVYRLDAGNSAIGRLNPTTITGTSYLDQTATWSSQYEYRVTSVGTSNDESAYASVVITNHTNSPDRQGRDPGTTE